MDKNGVVRLNAKDITEKRDVQLDLFHTNELLKKLMESKGVSKEKRTYFF